MTLSVLTENLALLKNFQEAAHAVYRRIYDLPDTTIAVANMFLKQSDIFVDKITKDIIDQFIRDSSKN